MRLAARSLMSLGTGTGNCTRHSALAEVQSRARTSQGNKCCILSLPRTRSLAAVINSILAGRQAAGAVERNLLMRRLGFVRTCMLTQPQPHRRHFTSVSLAHTPA